MRPKKKKNEHNNYYKTIANYINSEHCVYSRNDDNANRSNIVILKWNGVTDVIHSKMLLNNEPNRFLFFFFLVHFVVSMNWLFMLV